MAVQSSFSERHREMQEIARELDVLRPHNLRFREGDSQETMLMIAEAAVTCLAMERFLRIILAGEATEADTLPNLLEKATSKRLNLIKLINRTAEPRQTKRPGTTSWGPTGRLEIQQDVFHRLDSQSAARVTVSLVRNSEVMSATNLATYLPHPLPKPRAKMPEPSGARGLGVSSVP